MSHQEDAGKPVSLTEMRVNVEYLPTDRQWAGLDRGCSLTKILYITKEEYEHPETPEKRVFQCALFTNKDFEKGVGWFKKEAYLPKERGSLHVTGAGGANFRKWIAEQMEVDVLFQDEFLSQIRGAHFMLKYLDEEEICYPPPKDVTDLSDYQRPEVLRTVRGNLKEKLAAAATATTDATADSTGDSGTGNLSRLPAIFAFMGSGGGITRVNANATGKVAGGVTFAGKTFLGLGKALLGTADYDEICDLAEQGSREATSTSYGEVFNEGDIPSNAPFVCYGKLPQNGIDLQNYKRTDLALTHVAATALNIVAACAIVCANEKITQVYVGGNLVRSDIIRKQIHFAKGLYAPEEVTFHYLKTGHTGAIGAMMTNQEDQERFFEAMKMEKL